MLVAARGARVQPPRWNPPRPATHERAHKLPQSAPIARAMRKIVIVVLACVALCVGYVAWPFASLYAVVRAAQAGDVRTIEQRVDFVALRRSLVAQLLEAHARLSGRQLDRSGLTV